MKLKRHHKFVIGGFSLVVLIYMIVSILLINGLIIRQVQLQNELEELKADTQNKINEITDTLLKTHEELTALGVEFETIGSEFEYLKLSAGEDFSAVIEDAIKSVVTIKTDTTQGTAFIISPEGYLVTNAHILSGETSVKVVDYEKVERTAQVIGQDSELDIALLKVEGPLDFLEFENSDTVNLGEKVVAIGNPLGLQFSVSGGIVSGTKRTGPNKIDAYIQTDTALNPGNSGGPLINTRGKVIGINNFKMSEGESLGFALESNYIKIAINKISQENLNEVLFP